MDLEFHYYTLYLICKSAGLTDDEAYIISYSSQFTDDNTQAHIIYNSQEQPYQGVATAPSPLDIFFSRRHLLITFHFLPGEDLTNKLVTTANSGLAQRIANWALRTGNLYLIGIALHAYADTWAHQNFAGINHHYNSSPQALKAVIPNIGHADFGTQPDCVGVKWYDNRAKHTIYNNDRFLDCASRVFDLLASHFKRTIQNNAKTSLLLMLKHAYGKHERFSYLKAMFNSKRRIARYLLLSSRQFNSHLKRYDKHTWFDISVYQQGNLYFFRHSRYMNEPWYNFQEAARLYHRYADTIITQHLGIKNNLTEHIHA